MKVLVDTSIWSTALRKQTPDIISNQVRTELTELITTGRAVIIGAIRQEILSGIKSADQFNKLKNYLKSFPDIILESNDYEIAAHFYNLCRNQGVQGSHIDFLIAATAANRKLALFTLDEDFKHYAKFISLELFKMR